MTDEQDDMINFSAAHTTGNTSVRQSVAEDEPQNVAPPLQPMTPLAASATVINLILATGPFTYPYGYTQLGPVISAPLLFMVAILAYITATQLVEALAISTAITNEEETENRQRTESLFDSSNYATAEMEKKANEGDAAMRESEFYIREKIELGILAERVARPWVKTAIIIILTIYVYGAMSLKYVTGSISLQEGLSFLITGKEGLWNENAPWTYYIGIAIFGGLSIGFSFGDIEHSKTLQSVTSIMRIVVIILMYGGTIYYWVDDGTHKAKTLDWSEQMKSLSTVFGNTVFIFIYHHSIPGIVYPVRPQSAVPRMFLISNIVGALLLFIEAQLAWYAFSSLPNDCEATGDDASFPCKPDPNGFNQNFAGIPVIGQIVQFYPMLNVAAVPILTITLRNNLMQVLPMKRWLRSCDCSCSRFLLQDKRRVVKGVWAAIVSIPAIIISLATRKPQLIVTYTGGICGTFILLIIPVTLVIYARNTLASKGTLFNEKTNPNASWFQGMGWNVFIYAFSFMVIFSVIWGGAHGNNGGE